MNYKKLNTILGWVVFTIALYVYTATMEDTVSLWDCGEYISTANKLEVGHPPGAPMFNMLGRIFSAFVPSHDVAWSINFMSALVSAFTILFLFWSITYMARKIALSRSTNAELEEGALYAILGSGFIGALAYTFSDSFWFSAVEGEVYAMSSFFTAAVVWATFKWEERADEPGADRWLILIFFLIGLSIGVHLLNLLAIPALGYVYYFRKVQKTTTKGFILAGVISVGILGFVQAVLIPGIVGFPAFMERGFKNGLGAGFNVGLITFFIIMIGLVVFGLYYTHKHGKALWNTVINSFLVLCIGYSCFFMITIRSSANTPIDENNPENPISFLSYLNREQYGSWPVMYGPYWNSAVDVNHEDGYFVNGDPIYMAGYSVKREGEFIQGFRSQKEADEYIKAKKLNGVEVVEEYFIADDRQAIDYRYKAEHMTVFPRMYSRDPRHIDGYLKFSGYDPNNGNEPYVDPATGKTEVLPTFGNNLTFFFNYQVGWMYWRYFLWNFAGRQNDEQGLGPNALEGNWLTGLNIIDNEHIGDQSKAPKSITQNRAYNRFYMLPLILGLIGFIYHMFFARKDWFVILLLFIFTGFMIIVYLNPKPYEPRERDYAYAGSFYAFAFWIGLAVWGLYDMAKRLKMTNLTKVAGASLGFGVLLYLVESSSGGNHTFSYSVLFISVIGLGLTALMMQLGKSMPGRMIALVAILLGAPVPYIMASQGWDDHDRSRRTTALDFAYNFLMTCDPNAIIFTHGDNDTFPLWYAQEVEGIRTDVRIVNLSLLGTDWYIDQMVRKAYKSEPVPFSAPEYMYRQGGLLDNVQLDASKNKDGVFIDLKEAMNYVMNDANASTSQDQRKFMSIPSRTFSLKIDDKMIEKYAVVTKDEMKNVVKEMKFTVPKTSLYKNDVMILDLLAHNDWKRPVYFAGGADTRTYLGLQDYFSNEGMAYKLVPINTPGGNPSSFGKVNVEKSYNNIMKVYKWGKMNEENINVDYYVRRTMTNNYRLMFLNLAQELTNKGMEGENNERIANANIKMIDDTLAKGYGNRAALEEQKKKLQARAQKGKADKEKYYAMCKDVVNKCFEVMPVKNVPYDRIVPSFVNILYQIGEKQKANEIADALVKQEFENFDYYSSLAPRFAPSTLESASVSFRITAMLTQFADGAKDTKKFEEYKGKMEAMQMKLSTWMARCNEENPELMMQFQENFPQMFRQAPQPGMPQ